MKSIITCIAFATAAALLSGVQEADILAMGSKGGAAQSQDVKKGDEHDVKDHEGGRTGEGLSTNESGTQKREKPSPEKRPRLKYRDEPGCSC